MKNETKTDEECDEEMKSEVKEVLTCYTVLQCIMPNLHRMLEMVKHQKYVALNT